MNYRNSVALSMFSLAIAAAVLAAAVVAFPPPAGAHNDSSARAGKMVTIGENGTVLVRGAEVTALSGRTITARTAWGDTTISWQVDANDSAFVGRDGNDSSFNDVEVGDEVSFNGSIDEDSGAFAIDATTVKNWSVNGDDDDNNGKDDKQARGWGTWKNWMNDFSARFGLAWHR